MTDNEDKIGAPGLSGLALPVDAALDPIVAMDLDGRIIEWNTNAERTFGWPRDEAIGQELASLIVPPALRDAHNRGLARYRATGKGPFLNTRVEVSAVHRSGREFPVELAITPIHRETGTIFVAFLRDISERRRHEDWLHRRAREAEFLYQATALAAESESFEDALRGCIEIVCRVTGWPIGHALIPHRDNDGLVTTGIWYAVDPATGAAMREATGDTHFVRGLGLPGRIWQTGEPMWVAPEADDHQYPRVTAARRLGLHSGFGFPIKIRNRVVAVLEFFTTEELAPEEGLALLARTIGAQVGRLVERRMAEEHRSVLLQELAHRVKNTLAVVSAIANQTLRTSKSTEQFGQSFQARLQALARAHNLLTEGHWERAELRAVAQGGIGFHGVSEHSIVFEGPPVSVPPKAALALSLIFHELATNAAKYGALSVPGGTVTIAWEVVEPGTLQLRWRESGGPAIAQKPDTEGYGSTLVRLSVERDLGGQLCLDYAPEGLDCRIVIPLDAVANPGATAQQAALL